jgi:hypothetical protein
MKKIIISASILAAGFIAAAQPPKAPVTPGSNFGQKVTAGNAMPIGQLPAQLKGEEPVTAKVKAKVVEVCQEEGCWIKVQLNDSTTAFVRMKDHSFFVPTALKGKTVVIDGKANMKTTSVAELKHYAEDAKRPEAEIAAITQPKNEVRIIANGLVVTQ